jgi:phosphotransacetylase
MPADCNVQIDPNGDAIGILEIAQAAAEIVETKGYQTEAQVLTLISKVISQMPDYNGEVEDV